MRLAAGPTGELTALPRPSSWILGVGTRKGGKGRDEGKERGRKEGRGKGKGRRKDGTTSNKKNLVTGLVKSLVELLQDCAWTRDIETAICDPSLSSRYQASVHLG